MRIIKYSMENCSACRRLGKVIKLAELPIEEADIDLETARALKISSVPTIVKYDDNGKEVGRLVGIISINKLKEFCDVQ